MDTNDIIHGAALIWTGPKKERKLEVIGWAIDKAGNASEPYRDSILWASTAPIAEAKVRIRASGEPAALLRARDGNWSAYDGFNALVPVPPPYKETKLPIDLAFFGPQEVVLICADPIEGFAVKKLDGSDLPPVRR